MTSIIKSAGDYKVKSCADGTLKIYPAWPGYKPFNAVDGGGPGLGMRMELARAIEGLLNGYVVSKPAAEEKKT